MRIRSLHPSYLDKAGLIACRRESLLAKHVLLGKTKGYKNHPQLLRFKENKDPIKAIDTYLHYLYIEAQKRKYKFDKTKYKKAEYYTKIIVHNEQLNYEFQHLMKKLKTRDPQKYLILKNEKSKLIPHPLFKIKKGPIHKREKIKKKSG